MKRTMIGVFLNYEMVCHFFQMSMKCFLPQAWIQLSADLTPILALQTLPFEMLNQQAWGLALQGYHQLKHVERSTSFLHVILRI